MTACEENVSDEKKKTYESNFDKKSFGFLCLFVAASVGIALPLPMDSPLGSTKGSAPRDH
jgi:hypothetical protein